MAESDKYEVLEKIGHGSFGVIRKIRRKADGMILCRKEISYIKMSQKEREQLHTEFQILSSLRHPNIVGYFHREHLKQSQDLHLYMEYCGNGDLGRVIRDLVRTNKYAEEEFVWIVFSQLVTALYRCHYGIDPPEVGTNVLMPGKTKPKIPPGAVTILHRDLKPENVFLGENNSVKLGDFGLSKMIQSHDFASTYVGTPFYMSPEICAAERYTLKSDIWSLGCVIYELCAREPPFNAKSHFQLVQKIKEGKVSTLPRMYSGELMAVISSCLKVNPDARPDTATLLNLPVVRLMRMQREAVDLKSKLLSEKSLLDAKMREVDKRMQHFEAERNMARQEIEATLRREWEVKARLEIDRIVKMELQELQRRFEGEVQARVQEELQKKNTAIAAPAPAAAPAVAPQAAPPNPFRAAAEAAAQFGSSSVKSDYRQSLLGQSTDADTTDITEYSHLTADTPDEMPIKKNRIAILRAQTMYERQLASPMDIDPTSPSPIALASLSLSPRRTNCIKVPAVAQHSIFDSANDDLRWRRGHDADPVVGDSSSEDETPIHSSPTRPRPAKNPFAQRPVLKATTSLDARKQQQSAANSTKAGVTSSGANAPTAQVVRSQPSYGALRERGGSPNRRLSKIPSAANLGGGNSETGITQRKSSLPGKKDSEASLGGKMPAKNNLRGRTLVELQQARAGGRPIEAGNCSPKRTFKERAVERNSEPAAVWDPEQDDLPSPFLRRRPVSQA